MEFCAPHADRGELLRYLSCQDPQKIHRVFLIHGDYRARLALKDLLLANGYHRVTLPRARESFVL